MKSLPRSFFERNTRLVALELIGHLLVLTQDGVTLSGRIVETEAYFGSDDPASHAFRGQTPRNRPMFGPAGMSYVYFTYGNHYCLNVVTEGDGIAGAVLIRALEPVQGISVMKRRRGVSGLTQIASGPAKLTQSFGIGREHSEQDLTKPPFFLAEGKPSDFVRIEVATRIGISSAQDRLLRFYELDNPHVSRT